MATLHPTAAPPLTAAPAASAQPGGGLCMSLELAWGRLRRACLRRLRPAYVRRMAGLRQGHCPGCPHDVVDPRDLKFVRNVCGFRFRPEDDPFAWRGRLGLARYGLAEVVCFSLLFLGGAVLAGALAVAVHPAFWAPFALVLAVWALVLSFFRDPERTIPADADLLVSPADGTVTHAGEVSDPDFPGGRAFTVSIFLSVFNVHVNRVPRAGRVLRLAYYPGRFLDARHGDCAVRNEQFQVDLEDGRTGGLVRVKQVAGAVARRIVCWLRPGEELRAGERFGMIKFGSRTEVSVPAELVEAVLVKPGDTVKGGSTPLLRLRERP
ncbi:MAG TPA: phosphatidylserine decarboxylase [Gemmataceae bacterium]|nr:phosphatidylserine decarboxylase [Gemmataceae bacterium]